jgi:hypothetical protein
MSAASLHILAMSAPTNPGVCAANFRRVHVFAYFNSFQVHLEYLLTSLEVRPVRDICLSKRPGLRSA